VAPPRSIEAYGVGQSGCTAGRRGDPALERQLETGYLAYPHNTDGEELLRDRGTDERFTGRGGPHVTSSDRALR
jgi:hypothetical protein